MSNVLNLIFAGLLIWLACKYLDLKKKLHPANDRYYGLVNAISSIVDKYEGYDTAHAAEVRDIALKIARKTPMNQQQLNSLETAALLHDVGMLLVSGDLLKSRRKFDENEEYLIRTHTLLAEFYLKAEVAVTDDIPSIIRWHHERWDGFGYPDGLKGTQIPLASRIIAIADSVSAMKHNRSYRKKHYSGIADIKLEL